MFDVELLDIKPAPKADAKPEAQADQKLPQTRRSNVMKTAAFKAAVLLGQI